MGVLGHEALESISDRGTGYERVPKPLSRIVQREFIRDTGCIPPKEPLLFEMADALGALAKRTALVRTNQTNLESLHELPGSGVWMSENDEWQVANRCEIGDSRWQAQSGQFGAIIVLIKRTGGNQGERVP